MSAKFQCAVLNLWVQRRRLARHRHSFGNKIGNYAASTSVFHLACRRTAPVLAGFDVRPIRSNPQGTAAFRKSVERLVLLQPQRPRAAGSQAPRYRLHPELCPSLEQTGFGIDSAGCPHTADVDSGHGHTSAGVRAKISQHPGSNSTRLRALPLRPDPGRLQQRLHHHAILLGLLLQRPQLLRRSLRRVQFEAHLNLLKPHRNVP